MPESNSDARVVPGEGGAKNIQTGIPCLEQVFRHFGVTVDGSLAGEYGGGAVEPSWDQLAQLAKKHRLRTTLIRPTADELREVALPAIARMANGTYVTVAACNDEAVFLLDPRLEKPVALSQKQFLEAWGSELLVFSARYNWDYFKKKYNVMWFMRVILHYKR